MDIIREVEDFLNFFRPATVYPVGGTPYLGEEPVDDPNVQTGVAPLEHAVVARIADLASLVKWESQIPVLRQPEKTLAPSGWIKKLVYYLLIFKTVSLVAWRNGIIYHELHVFNDSDKSPSPLGSRYTYSDRDITIHNVHPEDIIQFSADLEFSGTRLKTMRMAEANFWERWKRANVHEGLLISERDIVPGTPEEQNKRTQMLASAMSKNPMVILTRGLQVPPKGDKSHPPADNIKTLYETIVRQWCHHYGLPSSLMNLDLPTHTQVSMVAAYGSFLRNRLIPLLKPVFEALEIYFMEPIEVDYSDVERASDSERAETGMRLSQTGYWTINELRERDGLPPREDGDEYPRVAGAPDKDQDGQNGGKEDDTSD